MLGLKKNNSKRIIIKIQIPLFFRSHSTINAMNDTH